MPLYPSVYATPDGFRELRLMAETDTNNPTTAANNALIDTELRAASALIEGYTGRVFVPYMATYYADAPEEQSRILVTPDDLLSLTTLKVSGVEVATTEYQLLEQTVYPKHGIYRRFGWFTAGLMEANEVEMVGLWGFNENPSTMWVANTTLNGDITSSATSVIVTSAASLDKFQYIKIGDEFMFIDSISTNTLTVKRGVNGTTAAAHTSADVVSLYQVPEDIKMATLILASYMYETRNNYTTSMVAMGDGGVLISKVLPNYVRDALSMRVRQVWYEA